jgi:hypothetical protein
MAERLSGRPNTNPFLTFGIVAIFWPLDFGQHDSNILWDDKAGVNMLVTRYIVLPMLQNRLQTIPS